MKLTKGDLDVGYVPLCQNLSNFLQLCLLYKFGGVYMDTDVMMLKNFSKLKESIGTQTLDLGSKIWSRLNIALMVFEGLKVDEEGVISDGVAVGMWRKGRKKGIGFSGLCWRERGFIYILYFC
ncbi:putative glycosyltransferase, DXD sugar-binding, nucleotide-diphospho-sugar transferase [Helianthus anomalus]